MAINSKKVKAQRKAVHARAQAYLKSVSKLVSCSRSKLIKKRKSPKKTRRASRK